MGLWVVEFIMQLEDRFDVKLEDAEMERVTVVADMERLIISKLIAKGSNVPDVFGIIKEILVNDWGHVPWNVRRESSFVQDLGFH